MISSKTVIKNLNKLRKESFRPIVGLVTINLIIAFFQLIYLNFRYTFINDLIPLWYTKPWGELQLSAKGNIFVIPLTVLIITALGGFFSFYSERRHIRYGERLVFFVVTFSNLFLTYSLFRIIQIASVPFDPIINPVYLSLVLPFTAAFFIVYLLTPKFIEWMKDRNIVTDPLNHSHPGMILKKPSARGGGMVFVVGLVAASLIFIPLNREVFAILLVSALLGIFGILDDYQNTHPESFWSFLENPHIRLVFLLIFAGILTVLGIKISAVSNPFDGVLQLDAITWRVLGTVVTPVTTLLTILWVVWVLNLLSWSNGIDGQYSGIVGIVAIAIAILALRFDPLESIHKDYATLAIITAGASFGLVSQTWHPSKIMWGFGATAAGLSIAALSILANTKITTSIIILLVPFLDAAVTVTRRVIQKKNPLKGDKGHLHHLLLERGWSQPKIAIFYWITTAIFGTIGIISAERLTVQTTLLYMGVAAFFIVSLNLRSLVKKPQ